MPVVLTDRTNRVWCTEQPDDYYLHAGFIGKPGPKIEDMLDFIQAREKQFHAFLEKKNKKVSDGNRNVLQRPQNTRNNVPGDKKGSNRT